MQNETYDAISALASISYSLIFSYSGLHCHYYRF